MSPSDKREHDGEGRSNDLSDAEIAHVNQRLKSALARYPAMPFHALLYRVGEVGAKRIEERLLRRTLLEVANNRRPRRGRVPKPGPWEPVRGVYVAAESTEDHAERAASRAVTDIAELASCIGAEVADELAEIISTIASATATPLQAQEAREITLGGEVTSVAQARQLSFRVPKSRSAVAVLILHDASWLYPDDRRLWRFLIDCHQRDERPIILARAIAPGTFPLLKALRTTGVQYYSTLVSPGRGPEANEIRDRLGWSHLREVTEMTEHRALDHLRSVVDRLSNEPIDPIVRDAVEQADAYGLSEHPTIPDVLRWWHGSELALPAPVARGWMKWTVWDGYRRGRRRQIQAETPTAILENSEESSLSSTEVTEEIEMPAKRGFGRETQVIPVGLPLSWREVREILAATRRTPERRR